MAHINPTNREKNYIIQQDNKPTLTLNIFINRKTHIFYNYHKKKIFNLFNIENILNKKLTVVGSVFRRLINTNNFSNYAILLTLHQNLISEKKQTSNTHMKTQFFHTFISLLSTEIILKKFGRSKEKS